jgi:signal transduction histidine kinase
VNRTKSDIQWIENLEEIISILRHELGNPVNSLKITIDVFRENYDLFDDAKKKTYLKRASELLARQEKLVDAMRSYSKFSVKEKKRIEFLPFWKNFSTMASNKLSERNIKHIETINAEPCLIKADNPALSKIVANILDNSIEAVEEVDKPTIELKVSRKNSSVVILIKDNGPGIRKKDMSKIFIPLFTTKQGKMGMGLAIAHKLSCEMGGRIEIKSIFGNGTEARLWLKTLGDQRKKIEKS